jgi:2-(3-amino-3-carboxypropyl)histidine synthase
MENSKNLPKNIALVYSVQYENLAREIKSILEKNHTIVNFSQVLGCSKVNFKKKPEALLLIGSGKFHATALASNMNLPIYMYEAGKLSKISEKEVYSFNQRKKAAYVKFLSSSKIGVLVSTKPGQQNLSRALKLKKEIKQKHLYFFLGDFLSPAEFENFGLDSWVNTACPRLDMDSTAIINISDLKL